MGVITYGLIGLYALLTGMAGVEQWKEEGFRVRSILFVIVSIGIIGSLLLPNKDWMLIFLIVAFLLYHVLAVVEGLLTNGRIKYSHHAIRFVFHSIMIVLVYQFIK